VHEARAEYFILNGIYDRAQIQLRNALKLAQGSSPHGVARRADDMRFWNKYPDDERTEWHPLPYTSKR